MAINYELLNKGGISLGTNFELLSEKPLDSRLVVPSLAGLQNYIDNAAAYEGMIAYVSSEKKHYEVKVIDGVLSYRPFGLTNDELNDLIANATTAAMEFKGATNTLPENPSKGDMYKVAGEEIDIEIDGVEALLGDSIVYDGKEWFLIPSGDDIEDTWRPVEGVNNNATLKFVDGDKTVAAVAADGAIKYNHATVAAPELLAENEQTRTYITAVETDGYGHITGYKTATENVVDTNTEYTFESQVESSSVYFNVTPNTENATEQTIYVDAYSKNEANIELAKKLDKTTYEAYISGKSMSDEELKAYADSLASNYAAAKHEHIVADITDFESVVEARITAKGYATTGEVASAKSGAEAKAAELDAALKSELQGEIDKDVKVVADDLAGYKTTNNAAVESKVAKTDYEADKATFALKTEVQGVDAKFANYVTSESYGVDKAAIEKSIDDESKARVAADEGFESRISTLEGHFGSGEGTVESQIAAAVKVEEEARIAAVQGVQNAVDGVAGRMTTAEGKIIALETASATHALKTEVEAVSTELTNYKAAQKLVDDEQDRRLGVIEGDYLKAADIANFETKENVEKVSDDLAAYVEANDAEVLAVRGIAEAARTEDEVNSQIDAKITALNLGTTYEPIGAEDRAKGYVDQKFSDANLGQYTTEQEVKDIVDTVIVNAVDGDTLTGLSNLVTYLHTHGGEASEMGAAIDVLEGKVEVIEGKPAYGITASQIENWDNEVGAKALAGTKTTTAEVKTQIEAYGYATTSYADQAEADAITAAANDAASKYEKIGVAQGIVDGLKLSETYEPIGAESRAIAAAEGKVNALAGNVYTKEQTYTKAEVDALLTWGEF